MAPIHQLETSAKGDEHRSCMCIRRQVVDLIALHIWAVLFLSHDYTYTQSQVTPSVTFKLMLSIPYSQIERTSDSSDDCHMDVAYSTTIIVQLIVPTQPLPTLDYCK